MQIILDMYHCLGKKCSSRSTVLDASKALCHRWYNVLMPAILKVAEEEIFLVMLHMKVCCTLDIVILWILFCIDLAKTVYGLEVLLTKLKPKGVKDRVKSRMNAIICFADVSLNLCVYLCR